MAVKETCLVVEKSVTTTMAPMEAPSVLLSAFYAYNMHYPEGCSNLYIFFEVCLLKRKKPAKKTRLTTVLARLA